MNVNKSSPTKPPWLMPSSCPQLLSTSVSSSLVKPASKTSKKVKLSKLL